MYFAGYQISKELLDIDGDFGLLTSFVEQRKKKKVSFPKNKKIILDSGAFSVMTGKALIDIDEYIDFIKKHRNNIHIYANLDVIGDYKKTAENQQYMESKGLNPLPTFHYKTNYDILKKMITKYDYIGLGGLVPIAMKRKIMKKHLDNCFNIIKDKCKVHGWGISSKKKLFNYPFYSVDSTSWLMGGKFKRMYKNDGIGWKAEQGTPLILAQGYKYTNVHNAKEILKMVKQATQLWKKKGVVWDE
jgi:hypothetical protein